MPDLTHDLTLFDVTEKVCVDCRQLLPLSAFNRNQIYADGLQYFCSPCGTVRVRKTRGVDPDIAHLQPGAHDRCGICAVDAALVLDHDHDTGAFRGWLCFRCNTAIGQFGDDPDLLQSAIRYLTAESIV